MTVRTTRPADDECLPYYRTYTQHVPDGDILHTLHDQPSELHALCNEMTEASAETSPAPGAWSAKQVLLHLSDTERLFAFRALWFARGEHAALPGMEPDPWAAITDAHARTMGDLLTEFGHVRAATVALFTSLDQAAWLRRGTASGSIVSVRALAWIIAGHTLHHNRSLRDVYL